MLLASPHATNQNVVYISKGSAIRPPLMGADRLCSIHPGWCVQRPHPCGLHLDAGDLRLRGLRVARRRSLRMTHAEAVGVAERGQHLVHGPLEDGGAGFRSHGHDAPLIAAVENRNREGQVLPVLGMNFDLPVAMSGIRLGKPQWRVDASEASVMLEACDSVEQLLRRWARVRMVLQHLVEISGVETETHFRAVGLRSEEDGRVVWRTRLCLNEPVR